MINTRFSEEELTTICQILKRHGTDCATLVDMLGHVNKASPNDGIATFKRVRLMKEFGILQDQSIICHTCTMNVINHHAETCEDHKKMMNSEYYLPCPDSHYDYSECEPAVWMIDGHKILLLENKTAEKDWEEGRRDNIMLERGEPIFEGNTIIGHEKDKRCFNHTGRTIWLKKTFPDIPEDARFNPWMGFFCDKHVGTMRPYADRIIGYR